MMEQIKVLRGAQEKEEDKWNRVAIPLTIWPKNLCWNLLTHFGGQVLPHVSTDSVNMLWDKTRRSPNAAGDRRRPCFNVHSWLSSLHRRPAWFCSPGSAAGCFKAMVFGSMDPCSWKALLQQLVSFKWCCVLFKLCSMQNVFSQACHSTLKVPCL